MAYQRLVLISLIASAVVGCGPITRSNGVQEYPADPPVGRPSSEEAPRLPQAAEIADRVQEAYAKLSRLVLKATVWEEASASNAPSEARAPVALALADMEPGRIRTRAFRPADGAFLLEFEDDGTHLTERTEERELTHADRPTNGGRDALLADEVGVDGCYIGGLLSTWLGNGPEWSSLRGYLKVMRTSHRVTAEAVDGRPCYVVEADTGIQAPNSVASRHWFFVDQEMFWLLKRVVRQSVLDQDGSVHQSITRTWLYKHSLD
jgi:hypothetical protein